MKISWPIISIISRLIAVGIGLIQTFIIIKLLPVEDFGVLGIIMGIGASVGVYQNLGISSGSTREISAAKNKKDAFKVFLASFAVRLFISVPLVLGLFFFAGVISTQVNNRPEIIFPLRLFAVTLLVQTLQSSLNSVVSGFREFKFLFIFQAVISVVSLIIYIPLIYQFGLNGYFYAFLIFNLISTLVLFVYCMKLFKGEIAMPGLRELYTIFKSVFSIGIFVYIIRIIDTQWQKLGPVVLAFTLSNAQLAAFNFALQLASKVITFSDAITDVTLPSMTAVYEKSRSQFKETFLKGNTSAFILITAVCVLFIILKVEIFYLIDPIFFFLGKTSIREKYFTSFAYMDPLVAAFWGYSHLNLLRSGFSVPAKKLRGALVAHVSLFVLNYVFYTYPFWNFDPIMNFSLAMGFAGVISYIIMLIITKFEAGFYLLTKIDVAYFVISICFLIAYYLGVAFYILVPLYSAITFFILRLARIPWA